MVGGRSSRMGQPKGGLPVGQETVLERLVRLGHEANLTPVLVGDASPYTHLAANIRRIPDDPSAQGPLAGLLALLKVAPTEDVLLVACDMPAVSSEALITLRDTCSAAVVVSKKDGFFEPFLARYPAGFAATLIAYLRTGQRSFQGLLRGTPTLSIRLDNNWVADWDHPLDITGTTDGVSWRLRPAQTSDEGLLWTMLRHASHSEASLAVVQATPELRVYVTGWGAVDDYGVVAESQGERVGAAWYRAIRAYGYVREGVPELAIATLPNWTGRGLGAAMLRALLHHGSLRFDGMSLSVRNSNPAKRLYQRFGFVDVPGSEITNLAGTTSVSMVRWFIDPSKGS